jgi:hypothetical protein
MYGKTFYFINNRNIDEIFKKSNKVDIIVDLTSSYISQILEKKYNNYKKILATTNYELLKIIKYNDYCLYKSLLDRKKYTNKEKYFEHLKNTHKSFNLTTYFEEIFGEKYIFSRNYDYLLLPSLSNITNIISYIEKTLIEGKLNNIYYELSKKYDTILIIK